jgi:ABC-2 type transport system permease protein
VLAIAVLQLRRMARDRTALLFTVVLPVVIILVIGTTFGGGRFGVGVVDEDGSAASRALVRALSRNDAVEVTRYGSLDRLRPDVRPDAVTAGLVIPAGYGAALARGDTASVALIADPTSTAAVAVQATVRGLVGDEAVVVAASRAAGDDEAAGRAAARLAPTLPQPGVRTVTVGGGEAPRLGSFDYTAPANLVLFVFVNTLVVGTFLAGERRQGITRRLLATPHGTGTIVAGVGLARFAFALGDGRQNSNWRL